MRLASRVFQAFVIVLAVAAVPLPGAGAVRAGEPAASVEGTWKLVVLAFGEDEFAVIKIEQEDGKPSATVVGAQQMIVGSPRDLKVDPIAIDGNSLTLVFKSPNGPFRFRGQLAGDGQNIDTILGGFSVRGEAHPARLQRTESNKVAGLKPSPLRQEYFIAAQDRNPQAKIQKLKTAIKKHAGNPTNQVFYTELLAAAEAGGLTSAEVGELVQNWMQEAAPYGQEWVGEVRQKAVKALGDAKPYAGLTLELAQQAFKDLDAEAGLEQKAAVAAVLARKARLAGKTELVAEAEARSARLEHELDEDYHKKVPPFQPDTFSGRKNAEANRVVLLELFTGAQCPPCVAADVAFDALLATYKPTEMIGLEYHLHIPKPDPLTNNDTVARQKYYEEEFHGTPSTFFNGRSRAAGGGPIQASQEKYQEFRKVIDPELESDREAKIDLSATRAGDQIEIKAKANLTGKEQTREGAGGNGGASGHKPRLRLVLVEDSIRYVGQNHLRFHHHVVRAMPGGAEGTDLSSGTGDVSIKLSLADLKREIEDYLSDCAKVRPFPGMLPEVAFNDLSVVAFVQDDADKSVLHAVSVPVKTQTP